MVFDPVTGVPLPTRLEPSRVDFILQAARSGKPSYFGSYCQPGPDGISSTASASIDGRSSDIGLEAFIHSPAFLVTSPEILLLAPEYIA
jgi:hypothetical protein